MLISGSKLGPYDIQSSIGAGGMGEVYRARDARLNRDVAIKVLPASFSSDPDRLQRFAQEARAAAALSHPNILAIFDIGENQGSPYIVSELLEGESLRDRLRNGSIPLRKAIDYAQQIARGLAAAHEKGIVHRDLKPENIFLTNDGRAKILDFGLAKLTRPEPLDPSADAPTQQVSTDAGTVMGTVGYMSPEQVRGKPTDPRSDIFALGAILYEMLSGKRAFHGDSAADTMSAILKEDPPELTETNRHVSPALERIVRHCLEKNPAERFQSAGDVAFNLEALTDISSSSRAAVRTIPEAPPPRRWLLPLLGGFLLLASWAGVYWLTRRSLSPANPAFHQVTFRRGTVWAARFSPDGQNLLYSAAWDGLPSEIFAARYDSSDSRPLGLSKAEVLGISATGELAVSLHPETNGAFGEDGTLARLPLDGGAPRELLDDVEWADWTADGQNLAVVRAGSVPFLNRLEFPAGNVIYQPRGWVSHVRISPRGDFLAIADHVIGGDDGRVVILDAHGHHQASSSYYSSVEGVAWTPSGKEVWFSAIPSGSARSLYAMDLSGKERLIYRAPGGLTIHDISRNGLVLLSEDSARMGILAVPSGETRERSLSWFDWSLLTDMSADGKTILFSESGAAVGTNYGIFLRHTDGSPAVRLGDGGVARLSPDGKWVVAAVGSPGRLVLLPTGAGQARPLTDDKQEHFPTAWTPDSKTILVLVVEPGRAPRDFLLDVATGSLRPLTPEGTAGQWLTPDGKTLLATDQNRQAWLYPLAGGQPQKLTVSFGPKESIEGFLGDAHTVLVRSPGVPSHIAKVDLTTGRREPFKDLDPSDPAGIRAIPVVCFSADRTSYAYSTFRILSDLYVVSGLK